MLQKLGAQRRIDIAKQTLTKLTSTTIPAGTPFAFRVFGREVDSCQTDLDVPVGPLNPGRGRSAHQRVGREERREDTDRRVAREGADDLKSVTGEKLIVLVTDGEETCGGDPAAAIEALRKAGVATRVSIVGFALEDQKLAATFRRWSDAGGGAFFDAKDAAGLDKSLTEALRPGFEVVNATGQVLASGIVGGEAVTVPAGNHTVRHQGARQYIETRRREAEGNGQPSRSEPRAVGSVRRPSTSAFRRALTPARRDPADSRISAVPPPCSGTCHRAWARANDCGWGRSSRRSCR